jgi:hypothetical protein
MKQGINKNSSTVGQPMRNQNSSVNKSDYLLNEKSKQSETI